MHLTAPVVVILRLRLDERVETIYHLTSSNNNHADRAHRRTLIVGGFKIYSCKIFHCCKVVSIICYTLVTKYKYTVFLLKAKRSRLLILFNIALSRANKCKYRANIRAKKCTFATDTRANKCNNIIYIRAKKCRYEEKYFIKAH